MNLQNNAQFRQLPPEFSDYELFPLGCPVSLVVPESSKNLVPNPSAENDTNGYAASGPCTIAQSQDYSLRGLQVIKVTPSATNGIITYLGLGEITTSPQNYSFSFDIISPGGGDFIAYMDNTTYIFARLQFKADGLPRRFYVKGGPGVASSTINLYIKRIDNGLTPWYTDGWLLERNSYGTTYFDGDSPNCYWLGGPHTSQSVRNENARGGRIYNLRDDLNFRISGLIGFGLAPSENITQERGIQGGEYLQRKANKKRAVSIAGLIQDQGYYKLLQLRKALIPAVASDNITQEPRALSLFFQAIDSCGLAVGPVLEMPVAYVSGLEGLTNNVALERLILQFASFTPPDVKEIYQTNNLLNLPVVLSSNGRGVVEYIGPTNVWQAFNPTGGLIAATDYLTAISGPVTTPVTTGPSGFNAGFFCFAAGTNKIYLFSYDTASNDFNTSQVAGGGTPFTFTAGQFVYGLYYINKVLYAGGSFTTPQNFFTSFVGSTLTQTNVATSGGPAATVRAVIGDQYGNVYALGDGSTNLNRMLKLYGGSIWLNTGTSGINGAVLCGLLSQDGNIYFGGNFTTVEGATFNYIGRYTPNPGGSFVSGPFNALGAGMNNIVRCLAQGPDGSIYAGGDFTTAGGVTVNYIAKWNGASWSALNKGLNGPVYSITFDNFGNLLASGNFTGDTGGNIAPTARLALWDGSTWKISPVGIANQPNMGLVANIYGSLFISTQAAGVAANGFDFPSLTTINNTSTAGVYPAVSFSLPSSGNAQAIYRLINYRTGKTLHFNYTLLPGETLTVYTDPSDGRIVSSIFGAVPRAVLPGSDLGTWGILPGSNTLGLYVNNNYTNMKVYLSYRNTHWSFDAAV